MIQNIPSPIPYTFANSCMRGSRKFDKGWKLHNNSIHEKASKMLNLLKLV